MPEHPFPVLLGETRGATSPIGVVLMVALVVILATVITVSILALTGGKMDMIERIVDSILDY